MTPGTTPIAIGWGGEDVFPGSTVLGDNEEYTIFFDILPYGLALQEPALVSMPTNWEGARVQWYDAEQQAWVELEDVQVKDGLLSFTAQTLGRFKAAPAEAADGEATVSEAEPYHGRDTACFMDAARGMTGMAPFPCSRRPCSAWRHACGACPGEVQGRVTEKLRFTEHAGSTTALSVAGHFLFSTKRTLTQPVFSLIVIPSRCMFPIGGGGFS